MQLAAQVDYWKLTTVVLAGFGAHLAYQQHWLGREKFKLDLFEKRFAVFAGTRLFLTRPGSWMPGDCTISNRYGSTALIGAATFLFDDDITVYLEQIYKRAVSLHTCSAMARTTLCLSEQLVTVRECLNRQRPFGRMDWQTEMASMFGLGNTLRPRGRRRNEKKSS